MKKKLKNIGLLGLFLFGSVLVKAQTGDPNWNVSKDVQRVANKQMFADESLRKSNIQAKSVDFPTIAISKRVIHKDRDQITTGNIQSKGYPMWTVSKGVTRYSNNK